MDVFSYLLGKQQGGGSPNLEEKEVTITTNTVTTIEPSAGYDGLSSVEVTTNVSGGSANLESKEVTISSNTVTTIEPSEGYDGLSSVEVTTNVEPNLESKEVSITSNGTTTVSPTSGYDGLSSVEITTTVTPNNESKSVTITSNGTTTVTPTTGYDGLSSVEITTNVSGGQPVSVEEKDVNFYDYEGTRVYSYTKAEFLALESMPNNPTHEGLTSEGWNWTLSDAKTYVTDYDVLNIGQMYTPTDASIRMKVELLEYNTTPYIGFALNGTATIDWGDNTTPSTVTGTSTSTVVNTSHTYASAGIYTITISSTSKIYLSGTNGGGNIFKNSNSISTSSQPYMLAIKEVNLGKVDIGSYSFYIGYQINAVSMSTETTISGTYNFYACMHHTCMIIPSGITSIPNYFLTSNYNIERIVLPSSITSIGQYSFNACSPLKSITIPKGVTTIGYQGMSGIAVLNKLILPSTITSLNSNCFGSNWGMKCYDFSHHTSVPTVNSDSFSGINSACKIVVPDNLVTSWKSSWSSLSSYIISKSDWDALQ